MGQRVFSETTYEGIGFGLGVAVMLDPARAVVVGSVGEYTWGGAASTLFWVDPREELVGIVLTQLLPSSSYPIRREMKALTYQALIDWTRLRSRSQWGRSSISEVPLQLGDPAATGRHDHGGEPAVEVGRGLSGEAEAPLEGARHLPPLEPLLVERAAGALVAGGEHVAPREAADLALVLAEAPHAQRRPRQVLHRVAATAGTFPVEDGRQAALVHDDVPVADIGVHDRAARRWPGEVAFEPAQAEGEAGAVGHELGCHDLELGQRRFRRVPRTSPADRRAPAWGRRRGGGRRPRRSASATRSPRPSVCTRRSTRRGTDSPSTRVEMKNGRRRTTGRCTRRGCGERARRWPRPGRGWRPPR